ncbi:MAG: hypothetical protein H6722_19010 [Sandaracinus sp.]|nr:hypothetical protein [Sandaracinus sp.]MCB9622940.1 hypothetical protein [Sandaracinus sp.]
MDGWTIASGDVSRLPTPSPEPISDEELWRADYPSAQNVQLRRVRRAHAPQSSRCVGEVVPRWEWGWVAVVPQTCGAFVSAYGVWWPVEAYGPPIEPTLCERFDEAYPWGMDSDRWPSPRARALQRRCPLEFAPRGAVLPPRARAAVAARRREFDFGWTLLYPPIRAALLAFSKGDDAFASFVAERVVLAEASIAPTFEGPGRRDFLLIGLHGLREELARRPTDTTTTSVRRLRDLAAHPGADDETVSHREDPRFRAVVAEGAQVLPELEACIADEGPRTRYVVTDAHHRWQLVPHADVCRAAREEILTGTPAYTWWDFARDFREAHGD